MNTKEQLYYLLQNYYHNNYDIQSFCEQFVLIYSNGIDNYVDTAESKMMKAFCELSERYSPYEEDLKLSTFFVDEEQFRVLFDKIYKRHNLINRDNLGQQI